MKTELLGAERNSSRNMWQGDPVVRKRGIQVEGKKKNDRDDVAGDVQSCKTEY